MSVDFNNQESSKQLASISIVSTQLFLSNYLQSNAIFIHNSKLQQRDLFLEKGEIAKLRNYVEVFNTDGVWLMVVMHLMFS